MQKLRERHHRLSTSRLELDGTPQGGLVPNLEESVHLGRNQLVEESLHGRPEV